MTDHVINLAAERYRRSPKHRREPIKVSATLQARLAADSFAEAHALADGADDLPAGDILDMIDAEVRTFAGRVEMMLLNVSDEKLEQVRASSIGRVSGSSFTTGDDIVDNFIGDEVSRRKAGKCAAEGPAAHPLQPVFERVRDAVTQAGVEIASVLLRPNDVELVEFSNLAAEHWPATKGMHQFIHDLINDEYGGRQGGDVA